jgi:ketosteroid isomerase-like protein
MAPFFAEDAFVMYPQPAPTVGRAANREAWVKFFARPNSEHPLTTDSIFQTPGGDLAYTTGRAAGNYDGPKGPVSIGGPYIAERRPIGGRWQIVALSANVHQPPPSMEPDGR